MNFKKIYAWILIVLGALAIIGSFYEESFYGFAGGLMFLISGLIIVNDQSEIEWQEGRIWELEDEIDDRN
jgi:hypothetical protein